MISKVQIDNDLNALAVWTQNNTKVIGSQINLRDVQPMATIVTPANGSVNYGTSLNVSWAATAYAYGATIESYALSVDGIEKASVPAGVSNYTVIGLTEGWHEVTLTVIDSNGNDFSTVARILLHVKNEGRIIGTIRDTSNNMASANIALSDGKVAQQFAGGFFFENVTSGTYNLTIKGQGFETVTLKVTVTAANTTDLGTIILKKQTFLDDTWVVAGMSVVAVATLSLIGWLVLKKAQGVIA